MSEYYDVFNDIANFPEAVVYIAYSRRGVGKTYGALWGAYQRKQPIVYIKRTIDDVNLICESLGDEGLEFDASPYFPINRDHDTHIEARKIKDGIGAFYDMDSENHAPIAYVVALSAAKKIKGIDMSRCELMICDEFIPQASETRVLQTEGEALLDLYETIARDRIKRGRGSMKLLLFANAEDIYCPIIDELRIMDDLAKLANSGASYRYVKDRLILIHHVNEIELTEEEKSGGLYQVMKGTSWHRKSYGGEFSKVDFSNVTRSALRRYSCLVKVIWREETFYIYANKDQEIYIGKQPSNRYVEEYDLNLDNDVRRFYVKHVIDIQEHTSEGHVKYSDYSLYDLFLNFSKRFKRVL